MILTKRELKGLLLDTLFEMTEMEADGEELTLHEQRGYALIISFCRAYHIEIPFEVGLKTTVTQ